MRTEWRCGGWRNQYRAHVLQFMNISASPPIFVNNLNEREHEVFMNTCIVFMEASLTRVCESERQSRSREPEDAVRSSFIK